MKGVISMKVFKGFSIKKYLLCIICSIIISTFIGFTILFVTESPSYIRVGILRSVNQNSEEIREFGNITQENEYNVLNEHILELKEKYGQDYPAEGLVLNQLVDFFRSNSICKTYALSLLIGVIFGTVVYIIFIQKATGIQMIIETLFFTVMIFLIILLLNLRFNKIINVAINELGANIDNSGYSNLFEFDYLYILNIFIGIAVIAYIVNLIYQKILVNKFNMKLSKKK